MMTLAGEVSWREEIKRSRFVARAAPVTSMALAEEWLIAHRDARATHNAWAWRITPQVRCHDDGEVGGTAGRPILGAVEKGQLDRVVVLVSRYYGGIKLGSGGLVRAYGGVAAACLRAAGRRELTVRRRVRFLVPFSAQGRVFAVLPRLPVDRRRESVGGDGLLLELEVSPDHAAGVMGALGEALRQPGFQWEELGDELG